MFKGLKVTLLVGAITLAGIGASYATAPVLQDLPDVNISDMEDNGATDNNLYVFTDAFRFNDYASDLETTDPSELIWTFDEWDPVPADGTNRWYAVNGKLAIHIGDGNVEQTANPPAHAQPVDPANEQINLGQATATFRDIVFTPLSDPSAPYVGPADAAAADAHAAGKWVRFFVSDGFNVSSDDVLVKTVTDPERDSLSGAFNYTPLITNEFGPADPGWIQQGSTFITVTPASGQPSTNGELRITISPTSYWKVGGWYSRNQGASEPHGLPYNQVNADNYVRAKFNIYAGPSTLTEVQIPSFRMRVSMRNAIGQYRTILPNASGGSTPPGPYQTVARDIAPSKDPARPSLYRVDFDPLEAPVLTTDNTWKIDRGFEILSSTSPGGGAEHTGYLALTESQIGIYPKTVIPETTPVQQYGATDFTVADDNGRAVGTLYTRDTNGSFTGWVGQTGITTTYPAHPTGINITATNGILIDMTAVPDSQIGQAVAEAATGPATQSALTQRLRIEENKLYKVRFHAISNNNTAAQQSIVQFQVKTLTFQHIDELIIGPSAGGGSVGTLSSQIAPGTGNQMTAADGNKDGTENGGYYNVIMNSPMSKDIRSEATWVGQPLSASMPGISAQPGPTENAESRRDIYISLKALCGQVADFGIAADRTHVLLDKVLIYRADLNADGGLVH